MKALILLVAAALLAPAAAAQAATISVDASGTATFDAAPGEANDIFYDEHPHDEYDISSQGATVTVGAGCEKSDSGLIHCHASRLVVNAGDGDDRVVRPYTFGADAEDHIFGGEGNDELAGNADGGPGDDRITASGRGAAADGGPGDDTIDASVGAGELRGGEGRDHITFDLGAAGADGGPGDDELVSTFGGTGRGGPGADRLVAGGLCGGCNRPGSLFEGGDGDDVLEGAPDDDRLFGGPGNDKILGHGQRATGEVLSGGDGDDVIVADAPDCYRCFAMAGLLEGGEGNDVLDGSPGDARRPGGDDFERLLGGPGNDVLRGHGAGRATELLSGGDGDDLVEAGGDALPPDAQTPKHYSNPASWPFASTLDGGGGNDRLEGGPAFNFLHGGDGDDILQGGAGYDMLDGGSGSDVSDGGAGDFDQIDLSGQDEPVAIDLRQAGGDGRAGENDTYDTSIELFKLTPADDRFTAAELPATVSGGLGDDRLTGGPAADDLNGDGVTNPGAAYGKDTLDGGGGDDELDGDAGDDLLRGGRGNDKLDGGRPLISLRGTTVRKKNADTIHGGPGDDDIRRGWRAWGGTGDDSVSVADFYAVNRSPLIPLGRGGEAHCGPGKDVAGGDFYDAVALDCESFEEGSRAWRTLRAGRRGALTLKARCAWHFDAPCRGRVSLVASGRVVVRSVHEGTPLPGSAVKPPAGCRTAHPGTPLANGRFNLRAGRVNRVHLSLTRAGRRALGRAGCVLTRARMSFRDPRRHRYGMTRTIALRRRR